MQLSNLTKYFIVAAAFVLFLQACGSSKPANESIVPPEDAVRTEPPFPNAEPEIYLAEVWQVTAAGTEKYLITRKGDMWRVDNAYGDAKQTATLHSDKDYVLSMATRTYAEYQTGHGYDDRSNIVEGVTDGLWNRRDNAVYEKIGTENGKTRYRVTGAPGKPVESIITIDDALGLPMLKEIYTSENGRTLSRTVKIAEYKTTVDDQAFSIPKDFKKVPIEEMRKVLVASNQ